MRRFSAQVSKEAEDKINYAFLGGSVIAGLIAYKFVFKQREAEAWLFRDDIGAPHGIKGYEEQVNSVGTEHGHMYWPHDETF